MNSFRLRHLCLPIAVMAIFACCDSVFAFDLPSRWGNTATDGSGLLQGDPTTLTWGFVADGTPMSNGTTEVVSTSSVISFFDGIFGETNISSDLTQRGWFQHFEVSFGRIGELSGVSYVYEPNDDGSLWAAQRFTSNVLTRGFLGVRADSRIAGAPEDGPSGILAANFTPDNGDLKFDTLDGDVFSDPLSLQNVIQHEAGHGLGLLHVSSSEAQFLMEPFLATDFFGPQIDDILGLHRGYGDFYEKSNNGLGNDVFSNATSLGILRDAETARIGSDARADEMTGLPRVVEQGDVDFISIDGLSDSDFISFELETTSTVEITLTPTGGTYLGLDSAVNPFEEIPIETGSFNNLSIQLFDTDGTTQLASDNSGLAGESDSISGVELDAGTYFVRVEGELDAVQLYELAIQNGNFSPLDFNQDGTIGCLDIAGLQSELLDGGANGDFDLNGDGLVNETDLAVWLEDAAIANGLSEGYGAGDVNLDGVVDEADFAAWNERRFTHGEWCAGDLNSDSYIDVSDFNIWNSSLPANSEAAAVAIPEGDPSKMLLFGFLLLGGLIRRRK